MQFSKPKYNEGPIGVMNSKFYARGQYYTGTIEVRPSAYGTKIVTFTTRLPEEPERNPIQVKLHECGSIVEAEAVAKYIVNLPTPVLFDLVRSKVDPTTAVNRELNGGPNGIGTPFNE